MSLPAVASISISSVSYADSGQAQGVRAAPASATSAAITASTDESRETEQDTTTISASAKAELSAEQLQQLSELQARDRAVRQHEAAHLAASGGLATSGASFSYQKGPDGVNYAVGGEVSIDTSPGRTPQETIERARIIQAAALAPAEPSGQDRAVAAAAQQLEVQARAELAQQAATSADDTPSTGADTGPVNASTRITGDTTQTDISSQAPNVALTQNDRQQALLARVYSDTLPAEESNSFHLYA